MYQVDEQPETIHLYVVREHRPRPSVLPLLLSVVALSVLVAFCVSTPSQQPQRAQRAASVKQFELTKQASPQKLAKAVPQILPEDCESVRRYGKR